MRACRLGRSFWHRYLDRLKQNPTHHEQHRTILASPCMNHLHSSCFLFPFWCVYFALSLIDNLYEATVYPTNLTFLVRQGNVAFPKPPSDDGYPVLLSVGRSIQETAILYKTEPYFDDYGMEYQKLFFRLPVHLFLPSVTIWLMICCSPLLRMVWTHSNLVIFRLVG